jgi:hypothetical protein
VTDRRAASGEQLHHAATRTAAAQIPAHRHHDTPLGQPTRRIRPARSSRPAWPAGRHPSRQPSPPRPLGTAVPGVAEPRTASHGSDQRQQQKGSVTGTKPDPSGSRQRVHHTPPNQVNHPATSRSIQLNRQVSDYRDASPVGAGLGCIRPSRLTCTSTTFTQLTH